MKTIMYDAEHSLKLADFKLVMEYKVFDNDEYIGTFPGIRIAVPYQPYSARSHKESPCIRGGDP